MVGALQTFWWFLVLIGVMILLHELGHYLVARLFDVKIDAFSFGFGPRLFGVQRGETDFRFCMLPVGGYVKMAGEQPGEEVTDDPRNFANKPRWQRLLVIFAGPLVNVILAIAILAGLYMFEYPRISSAVGFLEPGGAAARAGIQEGDVIEEIDGDPIVGWNDIPVKEAINAGVPMDVWVMRDGQRLHFLVTPEYDEARGVGSAGWDADAEVQVGGYCCDIDAAKDAGLEAGDTFVSVNGQRIRSGARLLEILKAGEGAPVEVVYSRDDQEHSTTVYPERGEVEGEERWLIGTQLVSRYNGDVIQLPFGDALSESWRKNKENGAALYLFIKGLLEQRLSAKTVDGPLGIAVMSGEAARLGPSAFLNLMAGVSINLAVVNLLPIPLLDGGQMLMLLIEMLMRRDLSLRVKEAVVKVGLVFIMIMIVFVIYNDLSKMLAPG